MAVFLARLAELYAIIAESRGAAGDMPGVSGESALVRDSGTRGESRLREIGAFAEELLRPSGAADNDSWCGRGRTASSWRGFGRTQ